MVNTQSPVLRACTINTEDSMKVVNENTGPNQHFDSINTAKEKILPVVHLLSLSHELNARVREPLTKEELGGIGLLLEDLLEDVFINVTALERICKAQKTA